MNQKLFCKIVKNQVKKSPTKSHLHIFCASKLRESVTVAQGEALNAIFSASLSLFLQMAATQDVKGKGEGGDQNFDYMFKLLIIGNSSVGKTSFLFRYADDSFSNSFVSTVGIDFKVKTVYRNDKRIKLQIWVSGLKIILWGFFWYYIALPHCHL